MLPKHPNVQRGEPATSPALARRREHMLHSERGEWREPRLVPAADDDPMPGQGDAFADDDFDPEIPPPPTAADPAEADIAYPEPESARRRLWPFAAGALGLIVLGGVGWIVYSLTAADGAGGPVPYITAEAGPEKIRPQDEGGLQVPNQDIRVYNELTGSSGAAEETEVLLPPPEDPVSPPVVAEPQAVPEPAEIPSVPAPDLEPAAGASAEPPLPGTATAEGPPPAPGEPAASPPQDEPVQTAAVTGAFRIQLAAVKSQDAAQLGWKKLTKAHPDILGGLTLNVVKVDRSSGPLYRLQAGPFADRGAAEAACGKLKQKRQDCLVVGP
jgi:cell division septation protein DedD